MTHCGWDVPCRTEERVSASPAVLLPLLKGIWPMGTDLPGLQCWHVPTMGLVATSWELLVHVWLSVSGGEWAGGTPMGPRGDTVMGQGHSR